MNTKEKAFVTLQLVLGTDKETLTAAKQGIFPCEKLGLVPFTALTDEEFKAARNDCKVPVPDGTGGMKIEVDDDKFMKRLIVKTVDKDTRSDFTFANKDLLKHLDVVTADQAVGKLLAPGEIVEFAVEIQTAMGFGKKAEQQVEADVKNC